MPTSWTLILLGSSLCYGALLWQQYPDVANEIFAPVFTFLARMSSISLLALPTFLISGSISFLAHFISSYIPFLSEDFVRDFLCAAFPLLLQPAWWLLRVPLGSAAQYSRNALIRWGRRRRIASLVADIAALGEDNVVVDPVAVDEAPIDESHFCSDEFIEGLAELCAIVIDFMLTAGELGLISLIISLLLLAILPLVGAAEIPIFICVALLGTLRYVEGDTWLNLLERLFLVLDWIFGFEDDEAPATAVTDRNPFS